jgi:hypothetical protein
MQILSSGNVSNKNLIDSGELINGEKTLRLIEVY